MRRAGLPVISIIVPCFNAAATLEATLHSALQQDIEKEVIVVDDGSTDGSAEILRRLGPRIAVLTTPNRGASAARTLGTQRARGQFLQYLDSDDLLLPGTLAERRAALHASGADIAHTDWQNLVQADAGGYRAGDVMRPDAEALSRDAEAATAASWFWAPPAALLYRRSIVERIGAWPAMQTCEDARFLFEAAARGARFTHVPGIGALYRVAPGSLSRRSARRFIEDCATNAREIEAIWRAQGPLPARRKEALAAMWGHVAVASLRQGLPPFEEARDRYLDVAARRVGLDAGLVSRRLLGADLTGQAMQWALRCRRALRAQPLSQEHAA